MEAKLNSPVRYRGTVATADLLPLNPDIGDMYNIESKSIYGEAGMNVAWNGVVWDTMGAPVDMSLYLTKEGADTTIQNMVNEYLEKNPVKPGATPEQAQQIEQNKTDIASLKEETGSLKEDLEGIAKKHVNLLENLQFYPGEFYTYESHNVSENSDFGRFELFNINANENYYFIDIFSSFSCVKYDDGSYSRIENTTTGFVSGIFKPTQNGVVAITGVRSSSSKNTLFTSSKEMYENKIYESYLSFSEKASDEVRKIMDYLPKTYYVEKDESGDFVKLSDAIVTATKYMDSVVYLGDGTWDLIEEFGSDFFNNATGGAHHGRRLGAYY